MMGFDTKKAILKNLNDIRLHPRHTDISTEILTRVEDVRTWSLDDMNSHIRE